jgi:hypothetical protein
LWWPRFSPFVCLVLVWVVDGRQSVRCTASQLCGRKRSGKAFSLCRLCCSVPSCFLFLMFILVLLVVAATLSSRLFALPVVSSVPSLSTVYVGEGSSSGHVTSAR